MQLRKDYDDEILTKEEYKLLIKQKLKLMITYLTNIVYKCKNKFKKKYKLKYNCYSAFLSKCKLMIILNRNLTTLF